MKSKKGFTLIELLAVIVILAIIALIATPIVLNMINEARKSAAKSSSLGFIDSIEYYAGFSEVNAAETNIAGYDVLVPGAVVCKTSDGSTWTGGTAVENISSDCDTFMDAVRTKSKGKNPDAAAIKLNTNGKVQNGSWVQYNNYYCIYNGSDIPNDCSKTKPDDPT